MRVYVTLETENEEWKQFLVWMLLLKVGLR